MWNLKGEIHTKSGDRPIFPGLNFVGHLEHASGVLPPVLDNRSNIEESSTLMCIFQGKIAYSGSKIINVQPQLEVRVKFFRLQIMCRPQILMGEITWENPT